MGKIDECDCCFRIDFVCSPTSSKYFFCKTCWDEREYTSSDYRMSDLLDDHNTNETKELLHEIKKNLKDNSRIHFQVLNPSFE